jgi:hypothetical protein
MATREQISQHGPEIAAIMKLLGLPECVQSFTLTASADAPPIVDCTFYPAKSDCHPVTELRTLHSRGEWELP